MFLQFQLHTRYCTKITLKSPNPRETSERMNFNVIDKKKQLTWKLFIYWYLMSFFHKKMSQNLWATIMPFGPVTNILLGQKFFFGPTRAGPHFRHWSCASKILDLNKCFFLQIMEWELEMISKPKFQNTIQVYISNFSMFFKNSYKNTWSQFVVEWN